MRSSREWFISHAGQVQGPFSTAGIRDRLSQGDLTPLDQICQAGGASDRQWKLIFECPEFIPPTSTPNAARRCKRFGWEQFRRVGFIKANGDRTILFETFGSLRS